MADKEQKKIERLERQGLAEKQKVIKPGECMKYITAEIDPGCLSTQLLGTEITSTLATNHISYDILSKPYPNVISWQRKLPRNLCKNSKDEDLELTDKIIKENHILLLMSGEDLVRNVNQKTLLIEIKKVKNTFPSDYKLNLLVCGLKIYCSTNRGCVSRIETEFALTEIQLVSNSCHRLLESPDEVATIILQYTKAIAEGPYKKQIAEKYEKETFYLGNDSKDTVRVQNGIGLSRLWQQQLIKLPMVTLEIAEAITSKYPMPSLLIKALENSDNPEQLLADLPIRRAGGPLASVRRIGPEISRKVCNLFMNSDPNANI